MTDVKAAARAEVEHGALRDCSPGIYVNLGTGLAVAIVVDGVVLAGRHGAAGEIGYNLRGPGRRDDLSVLEDAVSGKALGAAARQLLGPAAGPVDLFAAVAHDARAAQVLSDFVGELAFHLVNLTIAIDPARVVVGGGLVRDWDRLAGPLRAAFDAAVPFPPELVLAAFPFDAPLRGALALATRTAASREGAPA